MLLAGLETENVTRQMEAADLPASVDQHLVGPHRSAHDLVEVVRWLVLPVDLAIARKRHQRTHQVEGIGRRFLARRRRVTNSCNRMLEGSGATYWSVSASAWLVTSACSMAIGSRGAADGKFR